MSLNKRLAVIPVLALSIACVATVSHERVTESNKAAVRDYLDRLVNSGEFEAWPELVAGETLTFNGQVMSKDDLGRMRDTFRTILPDMHIAVVDQIAEGDVVASRVTITGTHRGDYMGLKASGKELSFSGITYDRLRDGKIVEVWHEMNLWGTLLTASDD